jgi:NAD(P)H dehydrogenase (quinone)
LKSAGCTLDTIDLHADNFDPRWTPQDAKHFLLEAEPDASIRAYHKRIDAADILVFACPIYWWSLPAMMKGFIDRVFTGGFAYDADSVRSKGLLKDRPTLILALGGGGPRTFSKYGYDKAISAQVDIGIFGYCGLKDVQLELLLDDDNAEAREGYFKRVDELARGLLDPERKPRETVSSERPN